MSEDQTPITPITKTPTSAYAWRPDQVAQLQTFPLEGTLASRIGTVVSTTLEGDEPKVRIPWLTDDEAQVIPEGDAFVESDPTLSEIVVSTVKIGKLLKISREQLAQPGTAKMLSDSANSALVTKADELLLTSDGTDAPTGIFEVDTLTTVPNKARDLDAYVTALAMLEAAGATNVVAVMSPTGWAGIQTLKAGDGSAQPLLGAGTTAGERMILGVPVIVHPAAPANGQAAFIDQRALAVVTGPIMADVSREYYFGEDAVALRANVRVGWKVADDSKVVLVGAPPAPTTGTGD